MLLLTASPVPHLILWLWLAVLVPQTVCVSLFVSIWIPVPHLGSCSESV